MVRKSRVPEVATVDPEAPGESRFEPFDRLFDRWAAEAVEAAGFIAPKPEQGRIPEVVKDKVARLWEQGICYPAGRARFRLADAKRKGPYNFFSYYGSEKKIMPNREYLVQLAAFFDLITEYGYRQEWMFFEYNELVKSVQISVDIAVMLPDGRKIFVEVKETCPQWQKLIAEVKSLGARGFDLQAPDRHNDPLRKAKYLAAGRPDFFAGYCPEGFDAYTVTYLQESCFSLQATLLPNLTNQ